jgi:hypothetical protein
MTSQICFEIPIIFRQLQTIPRDGKGNQRKTHEVALLLARVLIRGQGIGALLQTLYEQCKVRRT